MDPHELSLGHAITRRFVIVIHGGVSDSGRPDNSFETAAKAALAKTIDMALKRLQDGDNALDIAEAAVVSLKDTAVFNAAGSTTFNKLDEDEVSLWSALAL